MCRLYGFISSHPRKVECELIRSQNSLLAQSFHDETGHKNADGWGLGTYKQHFPVVVKEPEAAFDSEEFRWTAANAFSDHVISHVRRATIGNLSLENTHPFSYKHWMMAHNGHLENFDEMKSKILEEIPESAHTLIHGDTDSEHIFVYLISLLNAEPKAGLKNIFHKGLKNIIQWSHQINPIAEPSLNIIFSDGEELLASRHGRELWFALRVKEHPCEVCNGELHINHDPYQSGYQAIVIASEPTTTNEIWTIVPENHLLHVDKQLKFEFAKI